MYNVLLKIRTSYFWKAINFLFKKNYIGVLIYKRCNMSLFLPIKMDKKYILSFTVKVEAFEKPEILKLLEVMLYIFLYFSIYFYFLPN